MRAPGKFRRMGAAALGVFWLLCWGGVSVSLGYTGYFGSSVPWKYMQKHRSKKYAVSRALVMRDFFREKNSSLSAKRAKSYAALVERISRKYGVDPFLVAAVIVKESGVNREARSGIAYGLMQINWKANRKWIPKIFPTITSRRDLLHSRPNIYVGTYMLKKALERFGGNADRALDSYRGKNVPSYRKTIHGYYADLVARFRER